MFGVATDGMLITLCQTQRMDLESILRRDVLNGVTAEDHWALKHGIKKKNKSAMKVHKLTAGACIIRFGHRLNNNRRGRSVQSTISQNRFVQGDCSQSDVRSYTSQARIYALLE